MSSKTKENPEYFLCYYGKAEYGDQGGWAALPQELVEEIMDRIQIRYKYRASMVCKSWYRAFKSAGAWRTFVYRDLLFTRRRFTLHSGWQPMVDHYRLRFLVNQCTRRWRAMVIKPVALLFNLYEFLRVLTNFSEYYGNANDNPLEMLKSFEFNWSLKFESNATETSAGPLVYGTGGQVLKQLTHFVSHLHGLESLHLRHLLLDTEEAETFLLNLLDYFDQSLETLCIRNLTKEPHSLMHIGLFLNLIKLIVSPQHLNDDVVVVLATHRMLLDLVIVQDENTNGARSVSTEAWNQFVTKQPPTRVHLRCEGRCTEDMIWQPCAPVVSIAYSNPCAKLTNRDALSIVDYYAETLETYVQRGIQRKYRARTFHERCDSALILLLRSCPRLKVVGIRERLSTATLLYAANLCSYKSFQLFVRRNALIKKADWPYNNKEWSLEFYRWLKPTARDYDRTKSAVQRLLGEKCAPMTDNEYLNVFK